VAQSETTRSTDERALRELALVDRVIGLEAEVARLSIAADIPSPTIQAELDALHEQVAALLAHLDELRSSRALRMGNRVLAPLRAIKRLRGA